jgi:RimJ/RimL family protein N-acetyltransferase
MAVRFHVEEELTEDLVVRVAALAPANPFYTWNYVTTLKNNGLKVVALCLYDGDLLQVGCPACISEGFMNQTLEIESVPPAEQPKMAAEFWNGLLGYCRDAGVTDVLLETYASTNQNVPQLPGEVERTRRTEFVLNLPGEDLRKKLRKSHKSRVNKGAKSNLTVRRATDRAACEAHLNNCLASNLKRSSGGGADGSEERLRYYGSFLKSGAGELFQAVDAAGHVVSSVLVLKAAAGAYTHSSGSMPEGMEIGAAHFLKHQVSLILQEEGLRTLNLAGVDQHSKGLAEFKAGFGGERVELETVELYLGGRLKKKLRTMLIELRSNPLQFVRDLAGQTEKSLVFIAGPVEVMPIEERPELEFKKFTDHDLKVMAEDPGEMGEYARRFLDRSFNDGWAIWTVGNLAHVNWMITAEHDRLLPLRNLKLRSGEAEITHGITAPNYRGRGICPYAINRLLLMAGEQGIKRVFSIAGVDNHASHRSIQKGGLKPFSRIYRVVFNYLPGKPYLTFRGHRWKLLGQRLVGRFRS